MSTLLQDLRFALRLFRRTPVVTLVAIASLALGIGANAAIFSVVDALGFRPLAVHDEARLVRVFSTAAESRPGRLSYLEFKEMRRQNRVFAGMMAHGLRGAGLTAGNGDTELVTADVVSGDYFTTLGVVPAIGRPLQARDEFPGSAPAVVISDSLWRRRFGGDPSIVGKPITVSRTVCVLAGVVRPEFRGTNPMTAPDVYVPFETWAVMAGGSHGEFEDGSRWLEVTARLRPGVRMEQASADVATVAAGLAAAFPERNTHRGAGVMDEARARRGGFSVIGVLLFAVVSLVLLIACANVAGLLLGRAEARQHEVGVRLALGAGRGRLIRQLLVESAVLSAVAGVAGWLLASGIVQALPALLPPSPVKLGIIFQIDARVLLFTVVLALATAPIFGLVPALLASRVAVLPALRGQAVNDAGRRVGLRDALVVAQVAVCAMLLVGAGLVIRSLVNSQHIYPGFTAQRMVVATLAPLVKGSTPEQWRPFYRTLVDRAGALPDAQGAALANRLPLSQFGGGATEPVVIPGAPLPRDQDAIPIRYAVVDDHYFPVMGVGIVRGRAFSAPDAAGAAVVVISDAMARQYWPGGNAVGAHIQVGERDARRDYEIVGVAKDGKYNQLIEEPQPYMYLLWGQRRSGDATLLVRVRGSERAVAEQLRALVREVAPGSPMLQMITLEEHLRLASYEHRTIAILVSALGGVGLALAMVGLYGVVAYLVTRRAREIGIRMALGATPRDVLAGVLRRAVALAGLGVAIGSAAAIALGGSMRGVLFGVSAFDPWTHGAVVVLVTAVTLAASYLPARRAASLDPSKTLRMG